MKTIFSHKIVKNKHVFETKKNTTKMAKVIILVAWVQMDKNFVFDVYI